MSRLFTVLVAIALGCAFAAGAEARRQTPLHRVTIFGDSVAAALTWDSTARNVLERGDRLTLDLTPCGRLTTPGCFSPPPPSMLKEVRRLGRRISPTAVVLVGYNDDPHIYAAGIYRVLKAMRKRGVKHVLWLTLSPVRKQYVPINQTIHIASNRFPWMKAVNWGAYSRHHPSWFASDGIHLSGEGAVQFAVFVHKALKRMDLTGPLPLR